MRWAAVVAGVVLLAGCVATGAVYTPAPIPAVGDALVYIYRLEGSGLKTRDAYFYVDDVNIVDLTQKGYTWFHVPAGNYTLKQKWPVDVTLGMKTLEAPVRWQAGRTYFYRLGVEQRLQYPMIVTEWRLHHVPEAEAMRELAECRLQPAGGLEKLLMQRQCLTCK